MRESRMESLNAMLKAANRAEEKHGSKWIGAPGVATWRRLLILLEEVAEVVWAIVVTRDPERVRDELDDVGACIIGLRGVEW